TEANGVLTFVNERLDIEAMDAAFLDQPIQVDLSARQNQTYELDFDVSGSWDIEQSLERFQIDLEDKLSGTFEYQLGVDISVDKQDYTYAALLSSDLLTTNSSLPFPLNKSEGQIKVVEVEAKGDKIASMISVSIDDDVHFDGTLPHKEKQFNRAHLSLGQTDMQPTSMGVGFSISANLDQLVFDDWFTALKGISAAGTGDSQNRILGVPERIFLNIERFNIGGYNLTDVNSITRHNEDNWTIDFNSDQARFSALIDEQLYAQGISVDADYIKLTSNDIAGATVEKSPLDLDPKKLPPLDFNCSDCTFKQYKLGKIELETTPNSDGLTVEQLLVEGNSANLIAKGQWYKGAEDHYTYFAGDFNSGDVGLFLQSLNVDAGIRDSGANVGFALTWDDSPFDFKGENLNGELKWNLSDGYLSEVSDKGSRIFTLLSLDSLVRKLSLDFRDVFAKGFFYDEMGGTISITQGKADTRDTLIDGAAGEIEIYGYTDLATKALNYNVSFTPNVTGNLPVLVYFFTVSPPSALAALALDQVLTSAKVISNVNYSVTGTIDEPILIETGRQSTEVELPARVPENDVSSTPFVAPIPEDFLKFETQ
ncbi:MAG: AsmA-like C-terminal region-containing protein, partial [Pseudomonadota bacterium]